MNIKTILLLLMCTISLGSISQDCIDIQITRQNNKSIVVDLYPQSQMSGLVSSVVFALKWDTGNRISFGVPISNVSGLVLSKSGDPIQKDGETYQIFAGIGNQSRLPSSGGRITITIPKGRGKVELVSDEFIENIFRNGGYYVAVGGIDKTGVILQTVSLDGDYISDNVTIFPNPSSGDLTFDLSKLVGSLVIIQIYDIQGKIVFRKTEQPSDGNLKLNISINVPSGVYVLAVHDGSKIYKSKFVIDN